MPQYTIEGHAIIPVQASRHVTVEAASEREALQKAEATLSKTTGLWRVSAPLVPGAAEQMTVASLRVQGVVNPEEAGAVYRSVFNVTIDAPESTPATAADAVSRMVREALGHNVNECPEGIEDWEYVVLKGRMLSPASVSPNDTRCRAMIAVYTTAQGAEEAEQRALDTLHLAAHNGDLLFSGIARCEPTRLAAQEEVGRIETPEEGRPSAPAAREMGDAGDPPICCATFELASVPPAGGKQIDLDDMDRSVQELLRSLQQDSASPIIDWHYNDRGPSVGLRGEARAQISVFGRGPLSAETAAALRDALVSKAFAAHGSLVASATSFGIRDASPMEAQRVRLFLDSEEDAPAAPSRRRPRA